MTVSIKDERPQIVKVQLKALKIGDTFLSLVENNKEGLFIVTGNNKHESGVTVMRLGGGEDNNAVTLSLSGHTHVIQVAVTISIHNM
ncbi:hypothetical protein Ea92_12 [Erwinia phage Ea9-2]|uniref:Uncharacterized protein n=1 Tax=Erwinia phage Ea9-2 TaxID=1429767 RepID=W6B0Y9_9CAUD|nr:hypothetical protein Ea92_12 [Erwinia phage Ea9-2]AHI60069.1 hypothetical protein Ea92_12 [Erwinia phage Ea9-2]